MFKETKHFVILFFATLIFSLLFKSHLFSSLSLLALFWIGFFSFEYAINGGSLKRCLIEDFSLFGINGKKHRAAFAKRELSDNSAILGLKNTWTLKEIYSDEQYLECGNDILGKGYYFWTSKFVIPISIAIYLIYKYS